MTGPEKISLRLDLLGFHARVEGPARVVRDLARFFGGVSGGPNENQIDGNGTDANEALRFEIRSDDPGRGWHRIYRGGEAVWSTPDEREAAPAAAWAIRGSALKALAARYLLLHAGAVATNGRGVILAAPSGAGKSTLTAALLTAGFRYLSDEVAAVGVGDLRLHPFPGNPAVKEGSFAPLARICGRAEGPGRFAPERRLFGETICWLDVPESRCAAAPVKAGHIVFPAYEPGRAARFEPLGRSEALKLLAAQAFSAGAHTPAGMATLVGLLQGARCGRLEYGDLAEAVRLVADVADGAADAAIRKTYAIGRRP